MSRVFLASLRNKSRQIYPRLQYQQYCASSASTTSLSSLVSSSPSSPSSPSSSSSSSSSASTHSSGLRPTSIFGRAKKTSTASSLVSTQPICSTVFSSPLRRLESTDQIAWSWKEVVAESDTASLPTHVMEERIARLETTLAVEDLTWVEDKSPDVLSGLFAGLRCFSKQDQKLMGRLVDCLLRYMSLHRNRAHKPLHPMVLSGCFKSLSFLIHPFPPLLRALLAKMKGYDNKTKTAWTGQTVSEALQGLCSLDTTVPGVEDILKEFASIIKETDIQFFPHNIAYSISGLRSMSCENSAAVRGVLRALISKGAKASHPFSLKETAHVLYGMQSMSYATLEVRKALTLLAKNFHHDTDRYNSKKTTKISYTPASLVREETADACRALYGLLNFCQERDKSSLIIFRTLLPVLRRLLVRQKDMHYSNQRNLLRNLLLFDHLVGQHQRSHDGRKLLYSVSDEVTLLKLGMFGKMEGARVVGKLKDVPELVQASLDPTNPKEERKSTKSELAFAAFIRSYFEKRGMIASEHVSVRVNEYLLGCFESDIVLRVKRSSKDDGEGVGRSEDGEGDGEIDGSHARSGPDPDAEEGGKQEKKEGKEQYSLYNIEIDGPSHSLRRRQNYTRLRDQFLRSECDVKVCRVDLSAWNHQALRDNSVEEKALRALEELGLLHLGAEEVEDNMALEVEDSMALEVVDSTALEEDGDEEKKWGDKGEAEGCESSNSSNRSNRSIRISHGVESEGKGEEGKKIEGKRKEGKKIEGKKKEGKRKEGNKKEGNRKEKEGEGEGNNKDKRREMSKEKLDPEIEAEHEVDIDVDALLKNNTDLHKKGNYVSIWDVS